MHALAIHLKMPACTCHLEEGNSRASRAELCSSPCALWGLTLCPSFCSPSSVVFPFQEREAEEEKQRASLANEAARVAVGADPRMAKWFQMSQMRKLQQAGKGDGEEQEGGGEGRTS